MKRSREHRRQRSARQSLRQIAACYRVRKQQMQPDLRLWEFFVQMLVSAYFSWRWIGGENGQFQPWSLRYWECLARYSNLHELSARASLAAERVKKDGSYTIVASFRGAGAAERIKAAADSNRAEVAKIVRAELADILDNERNSIAFY